MSVCFRLSFGTSSWQMEQLVLDSWRSPGPGRKQSTGGRGARAYWISVSLVVNGAVKE